jgi:hypothetical protein
MNLIDMRSFSFNYNWLFFCRSPLKMARDRQKQNYKAGWLVNSPNNYVKQEMEETGTQNPKKFSKVCIHPISFRYQGCGYNL